MIADMAGVPLYVVHVSCEDSHEAIRRARQQGKRVWGEPLIQHLTLDEASISRRLGPRRPPRHVAALPQQGTSGEPLGRLAVGLAVGGGDRSLRLFDRAEAHGPGRFLEDPQRHRGLEDRMPMLWTHGVATGRLTPNEFVAVTSTNIAKILNLYPRKGAVRVGSDADLVVWDPEKEKTIGAGNQQSAIDYNVFEGQKVKGLPRFTLTRGKVAVHDGEIRTEEGHGQFVGREPRPAVNRALSQWKDLTAPRPVTRTGIPATGV
jgi:dihydropyrimidinase